jgi:hypothetical protein
MRCLLVGLIALVACGDDGGGGDGGGRDSGGRDGGGGQDGGDGAMPPGDAAGSDGGGGTDAGLPPATGCDPLPAASGTIVSLDPSRAGELAGMVRGAAAGTTFVLADGTYPLGGTGLRFESPGVTLRSASDDASAVIIDGEYTTNEPIAITADDVTIAHVTVTRAIDHPIHVTPPDGGPDVNGTLLYGLRIIDGGEQFVKINSNAARDAFVDDGRIECSFFRMTDVGRTMVERDPGGCYTGGVDAHQARGWVVRNNVFEDIYCAGEGLAEHAIHFWTGSRDTLVENNVILRCARGIGFGLVESGEARMYPDDPGVGYIGHWDGLIRNNVIFADHPYFDTGIELAQARGVRVYHNTVYSTDAATGFFSSIDYRFGNTMADIRNNITRRITMRDGAMGNVESNVEGAQASLFVDAAGLDFHLAAGATSVIDTGAELGEAAGLDIDGDPHGAGAGPDIGADELGP